MSQVDFIEENLNNLGELDRHDFKFLSENANKFFEDYSDREKEYIKYLFKLLSFDDFPALYKRNSIYIERIDGKLQFVNQFNQRCYEEDDKFFITPILSETGAEEFKTISSNIRKHLNNSQIWKQKLYSIDTYQSCNNYLFANSCTASIYDNEIINIFNSINEIKTEDLIKSIIEIGGKKAECFSDDFRLYTNIGFMPISVCKWDDRLASKKWLYLNHMIDKNGNIIQELINNSNYKLKVPRLDKIFFIYTGTKINISYNDWVQRVTYSENYTEAKTKRDNIYRKLMEEKLNG